jgi:hypothetical protein
MSGIPALPDLLCLPAVPPDLILGCSMHKKRTMSCQIVPQRCHGLLRHEETPGANTIEVNPRSQKIHWGCKVRTVIANYSRLLAYYMSHYKSGSENPLRLQWFYTNFYYCIFLRTIWRYYLAKLHKSFLMVCTGNIYYHAFYLLMLMRDEYICEQSKYIHFST